LPPRRAQIIHIAGDLSTENGHLSPAVVETRVLPYARPLAKMRRTYYASVGDRAR